VQRSRIKLTSQILGLLYCTQWGICKL